ncbi:hypothetical protein BDV10DRAFT_176148 [Aspergillus recurvatus]
MVPETERTDIILDIFMIIRLPKHSANRNPQPRQNFRECHHNTAYFSPFLAWPSCSATSLSLSPSPLLAGVVGLAIGMILQASYISPGCL